MNKKRKKKHKNSISHEATGSYYIEVTEKERKIICINFYRGKKIGISNRKFI